MITIQEDFDLRPYNTFRVSAHCRRWIEYTSAADIPSVMDIVGANKHINIGGGSNLLFVGDYDGDVVHSRIMDIESTAIGNGQMMVKAGAGVNMDELIDHCCRSGLWGLENLSGIPGDVGSSAVQNIGAYGVEVCNVIDGVVCYDTQSRQMIRLDGSRCGYAYRTSMFKQPENKNRYIIVSVEFLLSCTPRPHIDYGSLRQVLDGVELSPSVVRNAVISIRDSRLPSVDKIGSVGSYFKNPIVDVEVYHRICRENPDLTVPHYEMGDRVKIPAAWLIEQCGLKGMEMGNVGVWHLQPLVIVNLTGRATAEEILGLEHLIEDRVKQKFGIMLEPEVEFVK